MGKTIKFEDVHGVRYLTPVIEDSGAVFKRKGVLTDDDDYDYNRRNFKPINFTKKKSKKRNA
jgi:hypothetical protein